jgi:ABC-2 type transport system permease protein
VSVAIACADAALAVVKRDVLIFRSYRLRFASQMLRALFTVCLFYYISRLVTVEPFGSPDEYFAFAVVGIVIMEVLFATVAALPARVRQELVAGTFEKFVVSPFGAAAAVTSMITFPFALALMSGLITLLFAGTVFGLPFHWATVPLGLPLAILGFLSFAPFALLCAAAVILLKQAQSGVGFLMTGIAFVAGFVFPVALLPAWIQWTSDVQPFTPTVELLRQVLVDTPLEGSVWLALLKIGLAIVILFPLSIWVLSAAIRKSQRLGTIIEY